MKETLIALALVIATFMFYEIFVWVWALLFILACSQAFHKRGCKCGFSFTCNK